MNTLLDINAQIDGPFATPLDDPDKAVASAETFAFSVSTGPASWRKAAHKDGNIRHTPIVLGDGYPTIVASVMHRRVPKSTLRTTPPKDESGYTLSDVAEYDYHVGSAGFGADFDKALLSAIAQKHGMGMMEAMTFADWCTRILRDNVKTEALREVRQGIRVGVERGIEDSIDWPHYAGIIDKALGDPDEETPGHLDGLASEREALSTDCKKTAGCICYDGHAGKCEVQ